MYSFNLYKLSDPIRLYKAFDFGFFNVKIASERVNHTAVLQ